MLQLRSELDVAKQQHKVTQKEHEELVTALPEIREHAWECGAATIGTWAYIALRGLNVAWVRVAVAIPRPCRLPTVCDRPLRVFLQQKKQQEVAAKEMAELRARCETLNDENKAWRFSRRDMEVRATLTSSVAAPCLMCAGRAAGPHCSRASRSWKHRRRRTRRE